MKNWKIGFRIAASFAAVIVISLCLGLFAASRAQLSAGKADALATNYLPSVIALSHIQTSLHRSVGLLLRVVVSGDEQEISRMNAEILALRADEDTQIAFYESTPFTPEEAAIYAESKALRANFLTTYEEVRRIGSGTAADDNAKAEKLFEQELMPLLERYSKDVDALVARNEAGAKAGMNDIQTADASSIRGIMLGLLLCVALAIPIAILIVRSIATPLAMAVRTLELVAEGDLTARLEIESKDEVGRMAAALNQALDKLSSTLRHVSLSASNASSASQELAAAAVAISLGSQQQAASLEETSASLEEITAAVRQSADNAKQANQFASGSKESAEHGRDVVANAVTAMAEINAASAKIARIISTIDEIAFQTNLLAVNAAVEAARAGEEGRGFAVVASEVRSLAQRSSSAAKEIKDLIQDSLDKVAKGTELVNRSGEMLQGIVGSVKRVTDIVGEIAAASEDQSSGVEQVNTAMTLMDQVTQSNAAQTEELSSTAESLAEQAGQLLDLVATFKLGDDRGGSELHAAPAPRAKVEVRFPAKGARSVPAAKPTRFRSGGAKAKSSAIAAMTSAGGADDSSFEEF